VRLRKSAPARAHLNSGQRLAVSGEPVIEWLSIRRLTAGRKFPTDRIKAPYGTRRERRDDDEAGGKKQPSHRARSRRPR